MILAAVTINAAFNSGIIDTAVNGAVNYADAQKKEQITFDDLDKDIQDIVKQIEDYNIGGNNPGTNPIPTPIPLPPVGEEPPEEGWTVEEAKGLVERDGLKAHLGEKVDYNPIGGGTWRIFYYDDEDQGNGKGYFGDDVGTVYLKRDYEWIGSNTIEKTKCTPSDNGELMNRMNPIWYRKTNGERKNGSHFIVARLCDPVNWSDYRVAGVAKYAIGAPSIEMFAKSYNEYGVSSEPIRIFYENIGYNFSCPDYYEAGSGNVLRRLDIGPHGLYDIGGKIPLASPHWEFLEAVVVLSDAYKVSIQYASNSEFKRYLPNSCITITYIQKQA